ncbi:MAG: inositol-3-phosphate synthase [Candidatus Marsarchaeota archaeon]
MPEIRVALAGVGNCASALVQGVQYYSKTKDTIGLAHPVLGGYRVEDIKFVAAFDVNEAKVGRDLGEAIHAKPNNTIRLYDDLELGVKVSRGPTLDGLGRYPRKVVSEASDPPVDVIQELKRSRADILINYVPVGSTRAAQAYAEAALEAGVAFINAMPVFIASDERWAKKFEERGLPVAGDDVMSQIGATVLHKTLVKLMADRGVRIDETYQLNVGGDMDFMNMLEEERLKDKRESKTSAVRAMTSYPVPTRIGPSDYIPFLENEKVCYIWAKGRYFAGTPVTIELKLDVTDAPDSGGSMVDAIRAVKVALDRGVAGPLVSASAYTFKHPPVQMPYDEAERKLLDFVEGKLPRRRPCRSPRASRIRAP